MAVVRPARSSPPYALIIFIVLWVISTALAVMFYVWWNNDVQTTERAEKELRAVASRNEINSPAVRLLVERPVTGGTSTSTTIVGRLLAENAALKELIKGDGNAPYQAIDEAARAARVSANLTDGALVDGLAKLQEEIQKQRKLVEELRGSLATATQQYESARSSFESAKTGNEKSIDALKGDVSRLTGSLTTAKNQLDETVTRYEKEKTAAAARLEAEQREIATQIALLNEEVNKRNRTIEELKHELDIHRPKPGDKAMTVADGKIIRASLGSSEIWINLGKKDNVKTGLTFAVYDPRLGVNSGPEGRGKGAIEVIEVGDNQARARVIHTEKGQSIMQDDLIANLAYHRTKDRKSRFVIYGDFDLDGDGVSTPGEREKLERLVATWGGVIDDKLTTQTDYLVVGAMPGSATARLMEQTEQSEDLKAKRAEEQKSYDQLIADARDFSIPVLNANRFLGMIGYYNTTAVK